MRSQSPSSLVNMDLFLSRQMSDHIEVLADSNISICYDIDFDDLS